MTSTLYVDSLIEKTSGNGVHIAGHILQCKSFDLSSRVVFSGSASNSYQNTGVQVSITPTSADNTILVRLGVHGLSARLGGFHQEPDVAIAANGTVVKEYNNIIKEGGSNFWIPAGSGNTVHFTSDYIHSPNTTDQQTYSIHIRGNTSLSGDMQVAINNVAAGNYAGQASGSSYITVMEIGQ